MGFFSNLQNTDKAQEYVASKSTGTLSRFAQARDSFSTDAYNSFAKSHEETQQGPWTEARVLSNIRKIGMYDPQQAAKMYSDLQYLRTNKTSKYYNPYATVTNRSVAALNEYGIDTSVIDDDFYRRNDYLLNYLRYEGRTNTPSAPTKKSTPIERAAYEYYQLYASEDATKRAENQWRDLQTELAYWTQQKDRNYSDEEVLAKIDWSKYSELTSMDANKYIKPNEYNRAIGYSQDAMRAVIWAARQPNFNGTLEDAMVASYRGDGKQWQNDPEIAAKLNIGDLNTYSPYELGSTMEKERQYFGVPEFTRRWVETNRARILNGSDETAKKYYANIVEALDYTDELNRQLKNLRSNMDYYIDQERLSADDVIEYIKDDATSSDVDDDGMTLGYKDLLALDKTLETGVLKNTTSAVKYRWKDIEKEIRNRCATRDNTPNLVNTLTGLSQSKSYAEQMQENWEREQEKQGLIKGFDKDYSGNIDLNNRQVVHNPDGSISTELSITVGFDDGIYLLPTVVDGKIVSDDEAINHFIQTGEHLGRFNSEDEIGDYPSRLHERQELYYQSQSETPKEDKPKYTYEQAQMDADKANLDSVAPAIMKYGTDEEKIVFGTARDSSFDDKAAAIAGITIPDDVSAEQLSSDLRMETASTYMGMVRTISSYEQKQEQLKAMQERLAVVNEENSKLIEQYGLTGDEMESNGVSVWRDESGNLIRSETDEDEALDEAARYSVAYRREAEELQRDILELQATLSSDKAGYDEAVAGRNRLKYKYQITNGIVTEAGQKFDDSLPADIEALYSAGQQWEASTWMPYSVWQTRINDGEDYATVSREAKSNLKAIKEAYEQLSRGLKEADELGITISDEERRNIEQKIAVLKRDIQSDSDFLALEAEDFKTVANEWFKNADTGTMSELTKRNVEALRSGNFMNWLDTVSPSLASTFYADDIFRAQFMEHSASNDLDYSTWTMRIDKMLDLITDDEKLLYFYKLGTQGEEEANAYFQRLVDPQYGDIQTRLSDESAKALQDYAKTNWFTSKVAHATSFLTNVAGNIQSPMTQLEHSLEGKEDNPYGVGHMAAETTSALRSGSLEYYKRTYGGKNGEYNNVIEFFFNALTSAGDSAINAALTGVSFDLIGEAMPFVGKFMDYMSKAADGEFGKFMKMFGNFEQDFTHALPMAIGAASQAARQAQINGASPDQIKQTYITTLFAESVSEALTYGNVKTMFAKGEKQIAEKFFTDLLKNGAEEAFGEGFNQWWEDSRGRVIEGAMNEYNKLYDYYLNELKLPKSIAEEMVSREMVSSILTAAASGFFSSGVSGTVSYVAGRVNGAQMDKANRNIKNTDLTIITKATMEGNASDKTAALSGVLRRGVDHIEANAAAQHFVSENGDNALETMYALVTEADNRNVEMKQAFSFASLTDGTAHDTLVKIAQKNKNGQQITADDVTALIDAVQEDRSGENKKTYQKQISDAVWNNRVATIQRIKLAQKEYANKLKESAQKVKDAKASRDNAANEVEDAQDHYEAVSDNADDAVDNALNNPGNDATNGDVEQALNEKEGAYTDVETKKKALAIQEEKLSKVENEEQKKQKDILDEVRAEAQVEVAQQDQQAQEQAEAQAEQEFNDAVSKYNPAVPFQKPMKVLLSDGSEATIVGGYAMPSEYGYVWATTNGLVHDEAIDWEATKANPDYAKNISNAAITKVGEYFAENGNPVNPSEWLYQSVKGTNPNGEVVDIVGIQGSYDGFPVFVDSNGNLYDNVDFENDEDYEKVMKLFDQKQSSLPELTDNDLYNNQNPETPVFDGTYAYPGGPVTVDAVTTEKYNIVGFSMNDEGNIELIDDEGHPVPLGYVDLPAAFEEWMRNLTGEGVTEEEQNFTYKTWNSPMGENPNVIFPANNGEGAKVSVNSTNPAAPDYGATLTGVFVSLGKVYFASDNGPVKADHIVTTSGSESDAQFLKWAIDVAQNELLDPQQGPKANQAAVDDFVAKLQHLIPKSSQPSAPIVVDITGNSGTNTTNAETTGFKYNVKPLNGLTNKAIVAPVLAKVGNYDIDGIAIDDDGELVYSIKGQNGHLDAKMFDVSNVAFLNWAIEALDNADAISAAGGINDQMLIDDAKYWLQDQLSFVEADDADAHETLVNDSFATNNDVVDVLTSKAKGKKNPKTGEELYDWQDPKKHGKVKPLSKSAEKYLTAEKVPLTEKFKKFFAHNSPEALKHLSKNGKPILLFRGYGEDEHGNGMGKHLHVSSGTPATLADGSEVEVTFYSSMFDVAATYAGVPKITKLRWINNWETAKAAMQDIGLDLVEMYDPAGSGEPGYQVMQKNQFTGQFFPSQGRFFKENDLVKFRQTYGGSPTHSGIMAGYVALENPVVIDFKGNSFGSSPTQTVTAPDGTTTTDSMETDGWVRWAALHGADGVICLNVRDTISGGGPKDNMDVITIGPGRFKSVFNNGDWTFGDKEIQALAVDNSLNSQKQESTSQLENLMGQPISAMFWNVQKRLANGESVPVEEVMALPEFQWAMENKLEGSSIEYALLDEARQNAGDNWFKYITDRLPLSIVNRINEARYAISKIGSAVFDKDGEVTYNGEVARGKRLDLLIGLPASGKSTIADHISALYKSKMCDPDFAKNTNPLYLGGLNEDYVHVESKVVNDSVMLDSIANGENILLSAVGNDYKTTLERLQPFIDAGYSIHLHMTDLNQNKALGRMLGRLAKQGRFLDYEAVSKINPDDIASTFEQLKGDVDGYARWNTDVPQNTNPVATEYSSTGESDIFGRETVLGNALETGSEVYGDSSESRDYYTGAGRGLTPTQKEARKIRKKLKSPQQIAKTLVKSLGFGDYVGANNFGNLPSKIKAYWDKHAEAIAVKDKEIGNFAVTAHEVGHGIAQRFGLTATDQMVKNLLAAEPEFGKHYEKSQLKNEAFAEFMWRYLESDELARDFAGNDFVDVFERLVANDTKTKKALDEAKKNIRLWLNATTSERVQSLIRYENNPFNLPAKELIQRLISSNVDSTAIADEVDKFVEEVSGKRGSLRLQALFANHSQRRAVTNLTDSLTDANGTIIGDGLGKMLSDVGFKGTEENIKLLEEYALLLHSLRREELNKPVFGKDLSVEERKARIKEIQDPTSKGYRPDIVAAEAAWQTFRHNFLQAWMVDTGYWSQEFLDELEKMYPHYVPTFRVRGEMDNAETTGFGKSAKRYTLHQATGGSEDIYSPMYSFIGMVDQITNMVANNQTARLFDQYYQEYGGMGGFARLIPGEDNAHKDAKLDKNGRNPWQQELFKALDGEVDADIMSAVMKITEGLGGPGVNQSKSTRSNLAVQREDGTVVHYEISNPEMYKLLAGVQGSTGIKAVQAIGKVTRAMSMLTTGSNPLFALRNAVRDYQNSVNYGSWASNYVRGIPRWIGALADVIRESDEYKQYKAMGGGGWTRIQRNNAQSMGEITDEMFSGNLKNQIEMLKEEQNVGKTAKWALKKVWETVTADKLNEWIEQTSRFVEYKYGQHDKSNAQGRKEAFQAAQDVTVDFSRSGNNETAYVLKKLVPFFGASLQGVYRTGRMFTEAERDRLGARLTKTAVNTALASALAVGLIFKFGDDDDKKEFMMLSDGVKANHLILPNPFKGAEGQAPFIRIPLAQDPFTYAIHSLVTNAMTNGSDDEMAISLAATADVILDNLNPLGSGTIFQPMIDASHNRTWYGTPIVNYNMQDWTDESLKYDEDTPQMFISAGQLFGVSPEVLEYLATQYTGFLGQMAIPALSVKEDGSLGGWDSTLNAIVRKWTADPMSSNNYTKVFYDMKKQLATIADVADKKPQNMFLRSLTPEQVNTAYEEAVNMTSNGGIVYDTAKVVKEAYDKIDKINGDESLSDDEKYARTREIRIKMLESVKIANEQMQAYFKKYIQGETLVDRAFGAIRKGFEKGQYAHVKTPVENMPDAFQNDSGKPYMERALSVFNGPSGKNELNQDLGGEKESALPHPSKKFNLTLKNGKIEEFQITDGWDDYVEVYQRAYEQYLMRSEKGRKWDRLTDAEKYQVLQTAHSKGNAAIKEKYAKDNGIELKGRR